MLRPYRNNNQKKPLTANTHFSDGAPLSRMKRMNRIAVWIAAMPNWMAGTHKLRRRNAIQKLNPPSKSRISHATTNGTALARLGIDLRHEAHERPTK